MFSSEISICLSLSVRSKTNPAPTIDKSAYTSTIQLVNPDYIIPLFLSLNKKSFKAESNIKVLVT